MSFVHIYLTTSGPTQISYPPDVVTSFFLFHFNSPSTVFFAYLIFFFSIKNIFSHTIFLITVSAPSTPPSSSPHIRMLFLSVSH